MDKNIGLTRLRVYLAGPEVFLKNAIDIGQQKKELCSKYGFEGIFPIDSELNIADKSAREAGLMISAENERLIRSSDFIIANLTPFRGPSADVGTAYEMGFARGIGKKVFAYTNIAKTFTERTLSSAYCTKLSNRENGVDDNGMAIEKWGFIDNLMLEGSVHNSGGALIIGDVRTPEEFTDLSAFEKCLSQAKKMMRTR